MTSVLLEGDNKATKMRHKLMGGGTTKDETRSFLNFSRENLSISHSELEQGLNNRSRVWPRRNTILSAAALTIALLSLGLVIWQLRCTMENAREIERLKREVDGMERRFLEQNLADEFRTLHKELHAEEKKDDDPDEADIDNADYDFNYDENSRASASASASAPASAWHNNWDSYANMSKNEFLRELERHFKWDSSEEEEEYSDEFVKEVRDYVKNIEQKEEHKAQTGHAGKIGDTNNTKQHDIRAGDAASAGHAESPSRQKKESMKLKRSVSARAIIDVSTDKPNHRRDDRYHTRRSTSSTTRSYASDDSGTSNNTRTDPIIYPTHPPKKYYAHAQETSQPLHDDDSSEEIVQPNGHTSEGTESVGGGGGGGGGDDDDDGRANWWNARRGVSDRDRGETHGSVQNFEIARELRRRLTRRHLRAPRQVYAIHYGADSTLFSAQDEHTGNGRARHNNGVFKAWRPSDWVTELGMNRHFTLAVDGKLTVHETGLYLVYAQIHYLDEHDENGFHVLVNGRPILQCMVYSPGIGHKSRSCFSAQAIFLQAGDHLILKDVGSARYTLFQHDKSFFGLVKLGEPRQQQQRHQSTTAQTTHQ